MVLEVFTQRKAIFSLKYNFEWKETCYHICSPKLIKTVDTQIPCTLLKLRLFFISVVSERVKLKISRLRRVYIWKLERVYIKNTKHKIITKNSIYNNCSIDGLNVSTIRSWYSLSLKLCENSWTTMQMSYKHRHTWPFLEHSFLRRKGCVLNKDWACMTVSPYVQLKWLLSIYCCIKFGCMLEATCFPNLTWETWDLKGSWISMSLASPFGSRNSSSRLAKGLNTGSSQNLGRKPKCQPFTVPRQPWLIDLWS